MVSKPRLHVFNATGTVMKVTLVLERIVCFLLMYFDVSDCKIYPIGLHQKKMYLPNCEDHVYIFFRRH